MSHIFRLQGPFLHLCFLSTYTQNLGLLCTYILYTVLIRFRWCMCTFNHISYMISYVCKCTYAITRYYMNVSVWTYDVFRNASCQGTGPLGPPTCNNTNPMNLGLTTLKLHDTWLTRLRVLPVTTFCHKLSLVKHCRYWHILTDIGSHFHLIIYLQKTWYNFQPPRVLVLLEVLQSHFGSLALWRGTRLFPTKR